MAVTHTIAHTYPGPPTPPGELLSHVNRTLASRYTGQTGAFVTAFYGIYDPATRTISYASAGHPPPRLKRCADGSLALLDGHHGLPLGIVAGRGLPAKAGCSSCPATRSSSTPTASPRRRTRPASCSA